MAAASLPRKSTEAFSSLMQAPLHECVLETHETQKSHDRTIRPTLCHLLVSSDILRLSPETTFTASVLLHRYFLAYNNGDDDLKWIVAACLLLACKSEEEPRRLRDLINCALMISVPATRDESGPVKLQWKEKPPALDDRYWESKSTLVKYEQQVLRWLAFDVSVVHPHRAVILFVQDATAQEGETLIIEAWKRLNDAIWHVSALQQPSWLLTIAAIRFGALQENSSSPHVRGTLLDFDHWKEKYGLSVDQKQLELVEACLR